MGFDDKDGQGTSTDVLNYYTSNWDKIAKCYDLSEDDGLPIDPAWYRRRLYKLFLEKFKPPSVLDVGCGGGWSVLDALECGCKARGIEPVEDLAKHGQSLLSSNGFDPKLISVNGISSLNQLKEQSEDCIVLLSVLPHVPAEEWDEVHQAISRVLKPGGIFLATYRNELFDLFTFNRFTLDLFKNQLWSADCFDQLFREKSTDLLASLILNPDKPEKYFTASAHPSFGYLDRVKSNPLTISNYLSKFNLQAIKTSFYHFHCVPPLIASSIPNFRAINHHLEMNCSDDWQAHFMCSIFMTIATKS